MDISSIFMKKMVHAVGAHIQNVSFLKTIFSIHLDFIVLRYSATKNDVLRQESIYFQG
jgi:hypothetical protein